MAAKQGMSREALEGLSKDELVTRAEALGIDGARKFTRVELVDEITRAVGVFDRGLLGRARDLLRGVVERGLARAPQGVVDAAAAEPAAKPVLDTTPEPPVPTVTLAEIYIAQGHLARARAILREVLRHDEQDAAARALLDRLEKRDVAPTEALHAGEQPEVLPEPQVAPEPGTLPDDPYAAIGLEREAFVEPPAEPRVDVPPMLDDKPFPTRYDVDECVAMAVDPTTIYVYWELRRSSVERARRVLRRSSPATEPKSVLRILVVEPDPRGPRASMRDFEVIDIEYGDWFVRDLPAGSIVRAAVGLSAGERFLPLAHTHDVEAPPAKPSEAIAQDVVTWREDPSKPAEAGVPARPPVSRPLSRLLGPDVGTLGLPPLPPPPEDTHVGRGMSSAELARRARIERARTAAKASAATRPPVAPLGPGASDSLVRPGSASWASGR